MHTVGAYLGTLNPQTHVFYLILKFFVLVKTECSDNRLQMFNGSCYLFVSYPQVTWQTAQDICNGVQVSYLYLLFKAYIQSLCEFKSERGKKIAFVTRNSWVK